MNIYLSARWKSAKTQEKKLSIATEVIKSEPIWFLGDCNNLGIKAYPACDMIAITPTRIVAISIYQKTISWESDFQDVVSLKIGKGSPLTGNFDDCTLRLQLKNSSTITFAQFSEKDINAFKHFLAAGVQNAVSESPSKDDRPRIGKTNFDLVGPALKLKIADIIKNHIFEEDDLWFVLNAGAAGVLACFKDRLMVIKSGGLTGLMAGALGGGRVTTIYYRDITGIEYNSGFANGVLEISTPAYEASKNKDFWRGAGAGRNDDANDPWTLSNTLPLSKSEYSEALPFLTELKKRISLAKQTVIISQPNEAAQPSPSASIAQQVRELSELHQMGVLTDAEFTQAKAAILSS